MNKTLPLLSLLGCLMLVSPLAAKNNTAEVIKQIQEKDAMVAKTVELEYKKFGDKYVMRINPDTPLVATLQEFCESQKIDSAVISGIGSLKSATLGFFDPETKKYQEKTFSEPLEMASLSGNVSIKDGKPLPHLHVTIAGSNYKAYAGHLVEAQVSLTAEIIIEPLPGSLQKTFDKKTGLNLFDFNQK